MTSRVPALFAVAGLALMLAACSGGSDEPAAPANEVQEAPIVENMGFDNLVPPVAPSETPSPTPTPTATPSPQAPEEQVQDDADATGMTARVDRSDTGANETAPAEERQ